MLGVIFSFDQNRTKSDSSPREFYRIEFSGTTGAGHASIVAQDSAADHKPPSAKNHRSCYLTAPPVMPLMKRSRKRLYAIATGTLAISAAPISSPQ
jgi:hypothetical protein